MDGVINERAVADGQHGFFDDFGDGEAAGAPAGDRDDGFGDGGFHNLLLRDLKRDLKKRKVSEKAMWRKKPAMRHIKTGR